MQKVAHSLRDAQGLTLPKEKALTPGSDLINLQRPGQVGRGSGLR